MGTKNLYENGPNPFFFLGTKHFVRPTLMGTKNLYLVQKWTKPTGLGAF